MKHIPKIRALYAQQCQSMLDALAKYFPPSATWNRPEGGMFIWVRLPEHMDSMVLLDKAPALEGASR